MNNTQKSYDWVCHVCNKANSAELKVCNYCNAPANLNAFEIEALKKAVENGESAPVLSRASSKSLNKYYWCLEVSNGEHEQAKKVGNYILWLGIAIVVILFIMSQVLPSHVTMDVIALPLMLVSVWEINNFLSGKETIMGSLITPADTDNLVWRWIGLLLDIVCFFVGVSFISINI